MSVRACVDYKIKVSIKKRVHRTRKLVCDTNPTRARYIKQSANGLPHNQGSEDLPGVRITLKPYYGISIHY